MPYIKQKRKCFMKKMINEITQFIQDYFKTGKAKGAVIGMSGGKDSFVSAALCAKALSKEKVLGVIMPNGKMEDKQIAEQECKYLGIDYKIIDISNTTQTIVKNVKKSLKITKLNNIASINIAPRVRMTTLYSIAASMGYLVVNTSNLSETMIGYTTKWGDNVGDIAPLADLTKTEVCELGLAMGLPKKFVDKIPSDGLTGKTDEDNFGFSYKELDDYIRAKKTAKNTEKILKLHQNSKHKRNFPEKYLSGRKNYLS